MIKVRVLSINFGRMCHSLLIYCGHTQSIQSSMLFYVVMICANLFGMLDVINVVDIFLIFKTCVTLATPDKCRGYDIFFYHKLMHYPRGGFRGGALVHCTR